MEALGWQAWMTVGVIVALGVALVKEIARPDLVFLGALGVLLLAGIVPPQEAFAGFSNSAVLTVGALFVVAAGVQRTEALGFLNRLLFASGGLRTALPRIMFTTSFLSAFMNNTPIVAMLMPRIQQWSERSGVSSSKLLIPLSYAAIVGGMITLIGTSTNIVVSGLMVASGYEALGMFEMTWVGLPVAVCVLVYLTLLGHRLLPDRSKGGTLFEDGLKDCLFEVKVAARSSLIGLSVEEADLRALGDAFLIHVRRQGHLIPATPGEVLRAGDVLTFVGNVAMLEQLLERPGLERVVAPLVDEDQMLPLYEAVVADSSNLVGRTLREVDFREHYGGLVLGIQRKNERINGPVGRTPIKAGDLLLVEARNGFDKRWNASRDEFYLVAPRRSVKAKAKPGRAPIALLILGAMVGTVAAGLVPIVTASFAAALAMIATRCLRGGEARKSVDVQVLVVIAAALGIGHAMETTGVAAAVAHGLIRTTASLGVMVVMVVLYVTTNVLTELITHKAAAVLMLPVALAAGVDLGVDPRAFAILIAIAAAGSFMTPIGYQTNLMVMAAGGYRFRDYFKAGLPVSLLVMVVAVSAIYLLWMA